MAKGKRKPLRSIELVCERATTEDNEYQSKHQSLSLLNLNIIKECYILNGLRTAAMRS